MFIFMAFALGFLVIGQISGDDIPDDVLARGLQAYSSASGLWLRGKDQIRRLFDGFDLVEPGLTPEHAWRPGPGGAPERLVTTGWVGVARKPLLNEPDLSHSSSSAPML